MGLYLAEIFNVIYQGEEEVKPEKQIGTITVNDGARCQYLYYVDRVDTTRPSILPGEEVVLTCPAVSISSIGPLSINIDLFCGDYKGSIYFERYPPDLHNGPREERILSKDGTGEIVVLFALFDDAMEAKLEIKLLNNDKSQVRDLHGVVAANISDFERAVFTSLLFFKKPGCGIDVVHEELFPLSRSFIAVPFKSVLSLEFNLLGGNEEFVHDIVEYHADPNFECVNGLSSKKGDIIIDITWTCSPGVFEPDSDCESDSDCEITASD